MKRSRHRWLGFSIFCITLTVLSLDIPTTEAARATARPPPPTTTSTTAAPEEPAETENAEQLETEEGEANTTNSKYTGIPQVDYVYDPNLPRELNGYNLSTYPFYSILPKPELIKFECDGLHDGFYASVDHKCQIYHHCLGGRRDDFLCANYTAFDQKTFICQFVSEVDCKNSHKYFNRNDALYKATTTTTLKPPPTTTTTTTPRPRARPRRPLRYDYYDDDYYYPARDDYEYEDRGGRRRPRPRPQARPGGRKRGRPMDDYEEDRYERRPRPRDELPEDDYEERRPYDRPNRPAKRPFPERRPYDDEEERRPGYRPGRRPRPRDEDEDRYREDDRPRIKDRPVEKRPRDEIRPTDEFARDEVRGRDEVRSERPREETRPKPRAGFKPRDEVRPKEEVIPRDDVRPRDDIRSRDEVRPRDEIRPRDEVRPRDEIRPRDEVKPRDEIRPRDERPREELIRPRDDVRPRDDKPRDEIRARDERRPAREEGSNSARTLFNEGRRHKGDREKPREERPYVKPEPKPEIAYEDERVREERRPPPTAPEGPLVKPNGRGIFSMPRAPPKIKRPVPANERDKYEYVPITTTKAPHRAEDDEYYDDYEEEDSRRPSSSGKTSTVQQRPKYEAMVKEKFKPTRPHHSSPAPKIKAKRPIDYEDDDYYYEPPVKSQKYTYVPKVREPPRLKVADDYYDEYDDKRVRVRDSETPKSRDEDITSRIKDLKPNVKVLRRPFLPSRGGSPYLPRGLQPVAGKDLTAPPNTTPKPTTTSTTTTTTTTTTPKPTTTSTTTTTTTTTERPTTTTERLTTTQVATEKPTTTELGKDDYEEEYYDEDDIDYDKKESAKEVELTTKKPTTTTVQSTTEVTTQQEQAKFLAAKVLRVYNDNYQAIKDKLETTLSPGDYLKPYLAAEEAAAEEERLEELRMQENTREINRAKEQRNKQKEYRQTEPPFIPSPRLPEVVPEISNPYTATGKPLRIPENISIKQNLADSIENEFDVRLNEAITPNLPNVNVRNNIPSGFIVPTDRDYTFSRFRNNFQQEPQYAASESNNYQVRKRPQISGVSIRTPSSYYLQPQRYSDLQRPQRHLVYDVRPQGLGYF